MIHPVFSKIPDVEMARALSEPFIGADGGTTVARHAEATMGDGAWPHVPTEFIAASFVYIAADGARRKYLEFSPLSAEDKDAVADLYDRNVGYSQGQLPALIEATGPLLGIKSQDELQDRFIDLSLSAGKKLIGAHIVGRTAEDGRLIDALAYSKEVVSNFTLDIRGQLMDILADWERLSEGRLDENMPISLEEAKEQTAHIVHMNKDSRKLGVIAISSFFDTTDRLREIQQIMGAHQSRSNQSAQAAPPMSRAERRQSQQKNKRRRLF